MSGKKNLRAFSICSHVTVLLSFIPSLPAAFQKRTKGFFSHQFPPKAVALGHGHRAKIVPKDEHGDSISYKHQLLKIATCVSFNVLLFSSPECWLFCHFWQLLAWSDKALYYLWSQVSEFHINIRNPQATEKRLWDKNATFMSCTFLFITFAIRHSHGLARTHANFIERIIQFQPK